MIVGYAVKVEQTADGNILFEPKTRVRRRSFRHSTYFTHASCSQFRIIFWTLELEERSSLNDGMSTSTRLQLITSGDENLTILISLVNDSKLCSIPVSTPVVV